MLLQALLFASGTSLVRADAVNGQGHGCLGQGGAQFELCLLEQGQHSVKGACMHIRQQGVFGLSKLAKCMSWNSPA
jgi:hypothetical protein